MSDTTRPPLVDMLDKLLVELRAVCGSQFDSDDVVVSVELTRAFNTIASDEQWAIVMVALVTLLVAGLRQPDCDVFHADLRTH